MLVEVLRAFVEAVGELRGVARLDVRRAQLRIVGTGYEEQRLARADMLAWHRHDAAYRPADLRDHWRGHEVVVGDRAREAQSARQLRRRDGVNLDVGHLVRLQREE